MSMLIVALVKIEIWADQSKVCSCSAWVWSSFSKWDSSTRNLETTSELVNFNISAEGTIVVFWLFYLSSTFLKQFFTSFKTTRYFFAISCSFLCFFKIIYWMICRMLFRFCKIFDCRRIIRLVLRIIQQYFVKQAQIWRSNHISTSSAWSWANFEDMTYNFIAESYFRSVESERIR